MRLGAATAKEITDNHELGDWDTTEFQRQIDFANNKVGRDIGLSAPAPKRGTRFQRSGRGGGFVPYFDYSATDRYISDKCFSELSGRLFYVP